VKRLVKASIKVMKDKSWFVSLHLFIVINIQEQTNTSGRWALRPVHPIA
jgi:hypothetical protein